MSSPATDAGAALPWWRHAVVYQIYPRSFADANADGVGDIDGIRSRLPYLRELGVDAIWVSPWYPSPFADGGYDVADYRDIDPRFGTLDDARALVIEAHDHGIRVLVDLVPNHTSSEHPWFQAALAAGSGSPERARYVFARGRGPEAAEPPNNWTSVFGGPAWERLPDGDWYLHLFDVSQPDLNWENEEVRAEMDDILRFWLDLGVDGFRIDVAHGMVKDLALPDVTKRSEILSTVHPANHPHWDRDGVHAINRRWRAVLEAAEREVMMVAEAWVAPERLALYLREDEYHQCFDFEFLEASWDADAMRAAIEKGIAAAKNAGSAPTWTLSNHDVMRHATRHGLPPGVDWRRWPLSGPHEALDPELGLARARAAALLLLALPGSAYLYQGEELGLPEVWDLPEAVLDDPVWERSGRTMKGRDGCRVPIPWTAAAPSFGFGDAAPWLPQPESFGRLSAAVQAGRRDSTLELYRSALALRAKHLTSDEALEWIDLGAEVLAFRRGSGVICVVNFGGRDVALPPGDLLLSSTPEAGAALAPDAAVWLSSPRSAAQ